MLKLALILVIGVIAVVLYLFLRRSMNFNDIDMEETGGKCKEENNEIIEQEVEVLPVPPEAEKKLEESLETSSEN